jgi:hypothetical protein
MRHGIGGLFGSYGLEIITSQQTKDFMRIFQRLGLHALL